MEIEKKMYLPLSASAIWDEIDCSESYLVCCMFDKAASLASSVLDRICRTDCDASIDNIQLVDMLESAGMVLVQSLKELGRTSEMLDEVKSLFGSVTAIPIQVILTMACFQITEDSYSGLGDFLGDFLGKWSYVDGQYYILTSAEGTRAYLRGSDGHFFLEIEKYLEVVEVYAVKLIGEIFNDTDLAIVWVEKAELPGQKQQELLRRLRSLYSLKSTNSSQSVDTLLLADQNEAHATAPVEFTSVGFEGAFRASKVENAAADVGENRKQTLLKLTQRVEPCFWWYRTVTLKYGNARLIISHGKIVLWSSLIIFICYFFQKKRATLKQIVQRQALSVKKAIVDMWQLAFSVQVNPLAAVQPLPTAARGSR